MPALVLMFVLAAAPGRQNLHASAMERFNQARFAEAAALFRAELKELGLGKPAMELVAREKLVLSLYQAGDLAGARAEYATLRARFPDFRWNPNEVTDETVME